MTYRSELRKMSVEQLIQHIDDERDEYNANKELMYRVYGNITECGWTPAHGRNRDMFRCYKKATKVLVAREPMDVKPKLWNTKRCNRHAASEKRFWRRYLVAVLKLEGIKG